MNTENIPLKGIQLASPTGLHERGSCQEMINVKYENRAWRVSERGSIIEQHEMFADSQRQQYRHEALPEHHYIIIDGSDLHVVNAQGGDIGESIITSLIDLFSVTETVQSYSQAGNMLLIATNENLHVIVWDEFNLSYSIMSNIPNTIPVTVNVSTSRNPLVLVNTTLPSGITYASGVYDLGTEDEDIAITRFNLLTRHLNDNLFITGRHALMFGFELHDGTMVKQSGVWIPEFEDVNINELIYRASTGNWLTEVYGINYSIVCSDVSTMLSLKNAIKSIFVASTSERRINDIEDYKVSTLPGTPTHTVIEVNTEFSGWREIFEDPNFYVLGRIHTASLDEYQSVWIQHKDMRDIEANQVVAIDVTQSHITKIPASGSKLARFNGRFIIPGTKYIYPNFDIALNDIRIDTNEQGTNIYFIVYVLRDNKELAIVYLYEGGAMDGIYSTIFYPDSNATRLEIIEHDTVSDTYGRVYDIALASHPVHNFSYAIANGSGYYFKGYNEDYTSNCPAPIFTPVSIQLGAEDIPVNNNTITDLKTVRVSGVNNPWSWSALNTYTFEGNVLGVATNTFPLSEGQYGQFPLYVFHTQGISVLEVANNNTVVFLRSTEISREVCINRNSITGCELGVIFASSAGLQLLVGRELKLLSDNMDEFPDQSIRSNPDYKLLTNLSNTAAAEIKAKFINVSTSLSTDLFSTYLQTAQIAYAGGKNMDLIVFNSLYNYYYVFSLKLNMVTKMQGMIERVIDSFPSIYAMMRGSEYLFDLSSEHDNENNTIHIETNPIDMGDVNYSVVRAICRGYFEPHQDNEDIKLLGFYVFTSKNGVNWTLSGVTQMKFACKDIAVSVSGTKARYIKLILSGRVSIDSYINFISLQTEILQQFMIQ